MEDFKELGQESESLLKELREIKNFDTKNIFRTGYVVKHLIDNGYIVGIDLKIDASPEPMYRIKAITQKGKEYFELKNKRKKEKREGSRQKLITATISAVISAIVSTVVTYLLRFF